MAGATSAPDHPHDQDVPARPDATRDTSPRARADDPELLRRLLDGAPMVVITVDEVGTVTWVNGASERLFGYRPDELRGTNILDHIDLGWNPAALDSVGAAMTGSGLQRPMPYRLVRRDGTYVVAEVTANSQLDDPHIGGLAVYIRRWDERYLIDQVVDSLAGGVALDVILGLLVDVMGADNLDADGVVMLEPDHHRFGRSISASALPLDQTQDSGDPGTPWQRAMTTGEQVSMLVADLPGDLPASAAAHRACWAWPVPGPDGIDACLVLWRHDEEEPDHTCRFLMERLVRLTELVLQRERSAESLLRAANFDDLTGLANRANFFGQLQDALDDPGQGPLVGVLYVDLDGFKPVNDRLGHGAGDQVLRVVSSRLRAAVRADDLVSRLGGDEFTILCRGIADLDVLRGVAERITGVVAEPMTVGHERVHIGASIGIAAAPAGRLLDRRARRGGRRRALPGEGGRQGRLPLLGSPLGRALTGTAPAARWGRAQRKNVNQIDRPMLPTRPATDRTITQVATPPSSSSGIRSRTLSSQRRANGTSWAISASPAAMTMRPGPGSTSRLIPTPTTMTPKVTRTTRSTRLRSACSTVSSR